MPTKIKEFCGDNPVICLECPMFTALHLNLLIVGKYSSAELKLKI